MRKPRHRSGSACRPGLESLEGRRLPAQFGVPWHDPTHLSVSFVPDGTPVAGHQSDLFKALGAREPSAVWQREILRAFQTWAVQADLNFAVVPDGGEPLGTPGPDQHDPRFGDIRVGAQPMSPEVLSISVPHDPFLSGTWSGDILLNSNTAFDGGGVGLFPVLLHEVGHVLGLDHSDDPASVMFEHLGNTRDTLSPGDIAAVRDLYGPRSDDPLPAAAGNATFPTAVILPAPAGFDGSTPLFLYAGLQTPGDSAVFALDAPAGYRGPATVRLQTSGVSLLEPRLTVYDANGEVITDVASVRETGDALRVTLPGVAPGRPYYLQVRGAAGGIFGVGEYTLSVNFDARSRVGPDAIDRLSRQSYDYLSPDDINAIFLDPVGALLHKDGHTNDTFATAEPLSPASGYGTEAPDRVTASLGDPTDVDVYHIETPDASSPGPLVMTVTGRATQVNGLMPAVEVFDAHGSPVRALVLAHGGGTDTIQVAAVAPGADYFIRVEADRGSGKVVGNYDLDVEYGHAAAAPVTFVDSTLGGPVAERGYDLLVNQTQLFDLLLAAGGPGAATGSGVSMTVTDASGRVVAARVAGAGRVAGGDPLLLVPGAYRASFSAAAPGAGPAPTLAFRLYGAALTDPIGPALDDPTLNALAAATPVGPGLPAIGSPGDPYTWLAVTLSAPRVSAGSAARDGDGQGGGSSPQGVPAFLSTQGSAAATPPNTDRAGGPLTGAPAGGVAAPGRPAQSWPSQRLVVTALAVAAEPPIPADPGFGSVVVATCDARLSAGPDVMRPEAPTEALRPPDVATPAGPTGPTGSDPQPLAEERAPAASASRQASDAQRDETQPGPDLTAAVAVIGVFAIACVYNRRPSATSVGVSACSRQAQAVRCGHSFDVTPGVPDHREFVEAGPGLE